MSVVKTDISICEGSLTIHFFDGVGDKERIPPAGTLFIANTG